MKAFDLVAVLVLAALILSGLIPWNPVKNFEDLWQGVRHNNDQPYQPTLRGRAPGAKSTS